MEVEVPNEDVQQQEQVNLPNVNEENKENNDQPMNPFLRDMIA